MEPGVETRRSEGRTLGVLPDSAVASKALAAGGGTDLLCVLSRSAPPSRLQEEARQQTRLPLPLSLVPVVRHQLSQTGRPRAASPLSLPATLVGEGRSAHHPGTLASPLSSSRQSSSLYFGTSRPRIHCFSLSPAVSEAAKRNRESVPETQKPAAEDENRGRNLSHWRPHQEVARKERWGRRQVFLVFPRDCAPYGNVDPRLLRSASLLRGGGDNARRQMPPPSPSFVSLPPLPRRQLASEAQQAFAPFASLASAPVNTVFLQSSLCFPQGQTEKKSDPSTTTSSLQNTRLKKPRSPSLPASSSTVTSLSTPPVSSAPSCLSSSLSSFSPSVSSSVSSSLDSSLSSASSSVSAAPGALCASASLASGDLRGWPRAATEPAGVSALLGIGSSRPSSLLLCEAGSTRLNEEVPMGRLHAPPSLPWSRAPNQLDTVADKTAPAMTANIVRSNQRLAEASQTLATDTGVSSFPCTLLFTASRHSASAFASSHPSPDPYPSCHPSSYPPSVSPSSCAPCFSFGSYSSSSSFSCASAASPSCSIRCLHGFPLSSSAALSVSCPGPSMSTSEHCGFSRVSVPALPLSSSPGGRSGLSPSGPPSHNPAFEEERGPEATLEHSSLALFPPLSGETSPSRASRLPPVNDTPLSSPCVYPVASGSTGPLRCVSGLSESSPEQIETENPFCVSSRGSSKLFRSSPSSRNLVFSLGEHPFASCPSVSRPSFPLVGAASLTPFPTSLPPAVSTVPSLFSTSSPTLLTKSGAAPPPFSRVPRARLRVFASTREERERGDTKNLQSPASKWKRLVETATRQGLQATSSLVAQRRQESTCSQRSAAACRAKGEGQTDIQTAVGVKEKRKAKRRMHANPEQGVDGEEGEEAEEGKEGEAGEEGEEREKREEGKERGEGGEKWFEGIKGPGRRFDLRRVWRDSDEENRLRGRRADIGQVARESGGKGRASDTKEEKKVFSSKFSASSPRARPQQRHSISCLSDLSRPEPLAAPFRGNDGTDEANRSGEQIAAETERRQGRGSSVPGCWASCSDLHSRGPPRATSLLCLLPPGAQECRLPQSLAAGVHCSSCSSASPPSSHSGLSPRPLCCSSPTFSGCAAASARDEGAEEREPRLRETKRPRLQRQATAGETERTDIQRLRACRDPFRQRRQGKEDLKRETEETRERQEGVSIPGGRSRGQLKASKNGSEAGRQGKEKTEGAGLGGDREDKCGEGHLKTKETNAGDREKTERTEIGHCGEAGGVGSTSDVPAESRRWGDEKEEKQIRTLPLETKRDSEERTTEEQRALQSDKQERERREKKRHSEKQSREALRGEEGETEREGEQDDTSKEQKQGTEELVAGARGKVAEDNPAEEGEASRKLNEKRRSTNLEREKEGQTLLPQKRQQRRSHRATHSKSLDSEAAHEERRVTSGCEATEAKKTTSREHPRFFARKDVTAKAGKKPYGGDKHVQRQAASAERDRSRVVNTKEETKTQGCLVAPGHPSPSSLGEGENLKLCDTQGGSRRCSGFSRKIGRNKIPLPGSPSLASSSPTARAASSVRRSLSKEDAGDACSDFAFFCRNANKGRRTQVSAEKRDKEKKRDLKKTREMKDTGEMKENLLHERRRRQEAGGLSRTHSLSVVEVPFSCASVLSCLFQLRL
ncbi:UNVERIFIED_CONTAM: hypothetical protein HHA_454560 [Hammondia hammondi]|eukprot:XP_008888164.1 hypothetical protein HHA_454560 [Hammondia hammondi]